MSFHINVVLPDNNILELGTKSLSQNNRQEESKTYQTHDKKLSQIILSQISQNFIISKDSSRDQIANNCEMAKHKFCPSSD